MADTALIDRGSPRSSAYFSRSPTHHVDPPETQASSSDTTWSMAGRTAAVHYATASVTGLA
ncbi:hypothetical protein AB0J38_27975 [Streptomyces sp. NPDC050095]|uniref:hypothetical protein n=1 Tax=unclassified Streptomyces TaxID=2593676 RepID=UPI003435BE04